MGLKQSDTKTGSLKPEPFEITFNAGFAVFVAGTLTFRNCIYPFVTEIS
jgi:hypothetical protein